MSKRKYRVVHKCTYCREEISDDEYVMNEGKCDDCFDLLERENKK